MALKIMKANYEHIVKAHQNTPQHGKNQVSDEVKFQVVSVLSLTRCAGLIAVSFFTFSSSKSWTLSSSPSTLRSLLLTLLNCLVACSAGWRSIASLRYILIYLRANFYIMNINVMLYY
jgi:hypothetical protein